MSEDIPRYGANAAAPGARTNEFRALVDLLGWSQRETADKLEVDVRTARYWAAANPEPPAMAIDALRYHALLKAARVRPNSAHWSQLPPSAQASSAKQHAYGQSRDVEMRVEDLLRQFLNDEGSGDVALVQRPRGTI